jgi:Na+-translocating ferredoxin:NAD+ oxidoreductase RnfG subunit
MTRPRLLRALLTAGLALALVTALVVAAPSRAAAAQTFFTRGALLKSFFSTSQRVTYKRFDLPAPTRKALSKRLGYAAPASVTLYYGLAADGKVTGYAFIDEEMGQHQPITFAVLIAPDGRMRRLEVMVYRESHGHEVRAPRFRHQFEGKTAADPLRHGRDIVAVSGATISSQAMARGARRALILLDALVLVPALDLAGAR